MLTYSKFYSGVVLSELSGSENLSARSVYVELLFRRPKSDVFYTNEINVKDLAETSGLEQPTVYKTIKKLIAKGIIVKVYPHEKSAGIFYVEFPLEKQAHDAFMAEQSKEKEKPTQPIPKPAPKPALENNLSDFDKMIEAMQQGEY